MIKIDVILDDDGLLRNCTASGHAGAGFAGEDIICAAVSVLIRTAYSVLCGREGITISGDAPKKGQFWLKVNYSAEGRDFLFATGVFLIEGIKSVAAEYPDNCMLSIETRRI